VIDPVNVIEGISLAELHKQLEGGNLDPRDVEKAKDLLAGSPAPSSTVS
jgi:valyl-tRNA synthetase